jgi:hypothetical protein
MVVLRRWADRHLDAESPATGGQADSDTAADRRIAKRLRRRPGRAAGRTAGRPIQAGRCRPAGRHPGHARTHSHLQTHARTRARMQKGRQADSLPFCCLPERQAGRPSLSGNQTARRSSPGHGPGRRAGLPVAQPSPRRGGGGRLIAGTGGGDVPTGTVCMTHRARHAHDPTVTVCRIQADGATATIGSRIGRAGRPAARAPRPEAERRRPVPL